MNLSIITPVSRPGNIAKIARSIFDNKPPGINVYWFIVVDGNSTDIGLPYDQLGYASIIIGNHPSPEGGVAGHAQRNYGREMVDEFLAGEPTYIYNLDDDTLLHPGFYEALLTLPEDYHVSLSGQQANGDDTPRLLTAPHLVKLNCIDTGMTIFSSYHWTVDRQWIPTRYDADGVFTEQLHNEYKDKWRYFHKPISYYNKLR